MLDYTKQILDPDTSFCPRCFSPIKTSLKDYSYEIKVGETATTTYYSDGSSITTFEPIMEEHSETLPHLTCKDKSCSLRSKTQVTSAQSDEVRKKLKNNYSFCEMPNTLKKTYRLIAGDREDIYKNSMFSEMGITGFWFVLLFVVGLLLIVSEFKELDIYTCMHTYLFGPQKILVQYFVMINLLLLFHFAFLLWVNIKTKPIMNSKEFTDELEYFKDLEYDIYITKRLADLKVNERRKALKKARKAELSGNTQKNYTPLSESQKKAYRNAIISHIMEILEKHNFSIDISYYNHCYLLRAHSHSYLPDCDFFISKDSGFIRGSTRFNYGAYRGYVERQIADILADGSLSNIDIYVDNDLQCSRLSFGYLSPIPFDTNGLKQENIAEVISAYLKTMSAVKNRVSAEILATVEPEYMVFRPLNRNGFTWE